MSTQHQAKLPPDLLPCPFCGDKEPTFTDHDGEYSFVMCGSCGICASSSDTLPELDPVSAWNKRAA